MLAASRKADVDEGTIAAAINGDGRLDDAFTKSQHDFLADCGEIQVAMRGLTALDPIAATQWKNASIGAVDDVAAERWTVAGLDFLELSMRVTDGTGVAIAKQRTLIVEVLSRGLELDDSDESKTMRVMKRLAGLD